jgi:hypothetical protein
MKHKTITFLVGFFAMGLFYGAFSSISEVILGAMIFGTVWGLSEVFVFPFISERFKKKN